MTLPVQISHPTQARFKLPSPVRPFLENAPELPGKDVEASIGLQVQTSTITSESSEYKTFFII